MPPIDKKRLFAMLRQRLADALAALTASQRVAQEAATHPEARQEHSKDMRATEASYVARGLAERVESLRDGLRALELMPGGGGDRDAVRSGSLVTVCDEDGDESLYLLAAAGGGEQLDIDQRRVLVLTPQSPLGAGLVGHKVGETILAELPRGRVELQIVDIC